MKFSTLFFAAFLGEAVSAWKTGHKATGETDPNVTQNCSFWANDIASGDTCKALEKYFDLDFKQLHEWNPALVKDPCKPIEGWSYCVDSPVATNSLARLTGTDAPVLKNPPSTDSSSAASAAATSTATETSDATSSATDSASAQKTGGAASFGSANIPGVVFSLAFSILFGPVANYLN
ncbi:hypothetical protein NUU61_009484 [Penicillium alfredii]|uniref:LysM domain-containing protein n=1 Tax=Penicillium alfredii TaxID=1506179 RepID=A0A9W9ENB5_9EURO|nr:uncharacterized protein NUU61_009484 [Penicillium alfredii]KAJ5084905.1 hypothetical protein NUU61_009484 [Penicillium alfredii]